MVKVLHKVKENTHTKPQETLGFRMAQPKQSFNDDNFLPISEKCIMGVDNIQAFYTVCSITERNGKTQQHKPSSYE